MDLARYRVFYEVQIGSEKKVNFALCWTWFLNKDSKDTAGAKVKLLFPVEPYAGAYPWKSINQPWLFFLNLRNKKPFENKKKGLSVQNFWKKKTFKPR